MKKVLKRAAVIFSLFAILYLVAYLFVTRIYSWRPGIALEAYPDCDGSEIWLGVSHIAANETSKGSARELLDTIQRAELFERVFLPLLRVESSLGTREFVYADAMRAYWDEQKLEEMDRTGSW